MFAMFNQFFAMFTSLFSAGQHGAEALNHLAKSAENMADAYAQETQAKLNLRIQENARQARLTNSSTKK
jgi:hypothetical protein